MGISLNPDLERWIMEQVRSGRYKSAEEVVREGLQLLQERERASEVPTIPYDGNLAELFAAITASVPDEEWEKVPTDLSENLDHYLYGHPKRS